MDVTLEAAGYRVKLTHAGLEAADCRTDFTRGQGRAGRTTQLALTSEGLRLRPGDYQLTELGIASATGLSSRAA